MSLDGKVAAVLGPQAAALNIGGDAGVETEDIATVYDVVQIKDPDTGDMLGEVRVPKVRLRIYIVQPRLSIGRTYEIVAQEEPSMWLLQGSSQPLQRITENQDATDWRSIYVKVGDPVIISKPQTKAES